MTISQTTRPTFTRHYPSLRQIAQLASLTKYFVHGERGKCTTRTGMPSKETLLNTSVQRTQLSAITKLEGTSWYQGKDSIEDYIDRFQELIDTSEYSDNKTIVVKF